MGILLTATFDTRREADMTVEHLVQERGLDYGAIFIATECDANSTAKAPAGADLPTPRSADDGRDDVALEGGVIVSVEVADAAEAHSVAEVFEAFNSAGVVVSCMDDHEDVAAEG